MQSQFGRDVLGVVRLDEARRHKAKEKEILVDILNDTDKDTMKTLKQEAKTEKQEYSQLKKRACKRMFRVGAFCELSYAKGRTYQNVFLTKNNVYKFLTEWECYDNI